MADLILVLCVLVVFAMLSCVKFVREQQRLAKFTLDKFHSLLGPGIVFKNPYNFYDHVWLSIGDQGKVITSTIGEFFSHLVPIMSDGELTVGDRIRIKEFKTNSVLVIRDPNPTRIVKCEKCGHNMSV
jgi:hypothetical protein